MLPILNPVVFPDELLGILSKHLKNPKASTWSDGRLAMQLRQYDLKQTKDEEIHLLDLQVGNTFSFNDRLFKKIYKRRTRILCQECSTGRKYLIPQQAVVKLVEVRSVWNLNQ